MDTTLSGLQNYAYGAAVGSGIDPNVFMWQIGQESGWNPNATNGNAQGIAQFMPSYINNYAPADRTDPYASLDAAAKFDASLLNGRCNGDYMCMLNHYGTTAHVGQNVIDRAKAAIAHALPFTDNSTSSQDSSVTSDGCGKLDFACMFKSWFANWGTRIVTIILGLIFLAGSIYLYKSR